MYRVESLRAPGRKNTGPEAHAGWSWSGLGFLLTETLPALQGLRGPKKINLKEMPLEPGTWFWAWGGLG